MFRCRALDVNAVRREKSTIDQLLIRASRLAGEGAEAAWRALSAFLLPPTCCLCGARGLGHGFDLCRVCHGLLPPAAAGDEDPAGFDLVLAPYRYAYPVRHFVQGLKFRGERHYARVLGELLARARRELDLPLPGVLVTVPLHPLRYRVRGFNQSQELARFAARALGLRVDPGCLERVIATREQSALPPRARRRNVRGAFRLVRLPQSMRVALVDDVITTGSTASEAARVLRRAGVERIELWAAARAPAPGAARAAPRPDGVPGTV